MPFEIKREPPKFTSTFWSGATSRSHSVSSSHGVLTINGDGLVMKRVISNCCPIISATGENHFELWTAFAFDIREWEEYWGKKFEDAGDLNILDLGFWWVDEHGKIRYESPELSWREELKKSRMGLL